MTNRMEGRDPRRYSPRGAFSLAARVIACSHIRILSSYMSGSQAAISVQEVRFAGNWGRKIDDEEITQLGGNIRDLVVARLTLFRKCSNHDGGMPGGCHSVTPTPDFTNTTPRGMLSFAKHPWRRSGPMGTQIMPLVPEDLRMVVNVLLERTSIRQWSSIISKKARVCSSF